MKTSFVFLFIIGMLIQAPASESMVGNPALVSYLKSVDATSPAPEIANQIARSWDESILASEVFSSYQKTKAAAEPSHPYDCVVSEYVFNGIKVVTKQTFCVWFAKIDSPGKDANPSKTASALLKLKSEFETGTLDQANKGAAEVQKLFETNSVVYRYVKKSGGTEVPSWRNELRVVSDGKSIYIWTLKLSGQPMAAVIGYWDKLNKNWFVRLGRSPVKSHKK